MIRSGIGLLVVLTSLSLLFCQHQGVSADAEPDNADEKVVNAAGFKADKAGLLDFFHKRSLNDEARKDCLVLIKQLGSGVFEERKRASKDLVWRGRMVVPLLRQALKDDDAEVVRLAKACLEKIEAANPALLLAAARLLLRCDSDEAVPTLLNYLAYAASDWETRDLLRLLVDTCPAEKLHPALSAALRGPPTPRRASAAFILARKGTDADRNAVRKLLADNDLMVRYRAAEGLLGVQDKASVPALITLLEDAPADLARQAEDTLFLVAGQTGPTVVLGSEASAPSRRKCGVAWAAWWKENEGKIDLKPYLEGERVIGLTLGVEYNTGRVWECGRDKTLRWEIKGLKGPVDAVRLPGDMVLIAESGTNTVSVRDFKGTIGWKKNFDGEVWGCQLLPNGKLLISTFDTLEKPNPPHGTITERFNCLHELDAKGEEVSAIRLARLDRSSLAIRKARNGHLVLVGGSVSEVDAKGKCLRWIELPEGEYTDLQALPDDHFIVTSVKLGNVVEVNAEGKVLWQAIVPGACGVCRLPNGHTLVGTNKRVVELNDKGEVIWEMKTEGYIRRIHSGLN